MPDVAAALRVQLLRLIAHWEGAVLALDEPSNYATHAAWHSLEAYLDLALRRELQAAIDRLKHDLALLRQRFDAAGTLQDLDAVARGVQAFRRSFGRVETVVEFYGDAVNRRTGPKQAAVLSACDRLAAASMEQILPALGHSVPPVLTYVDKGMGASILRHGLRLWDPNSISPAAAIKITRHNLYRPTSLTHESGHQVFYTLGWTDELKAVLAERLQARSPRLAEVWAGWTSELAADVFAHVTCGYAATAALHDVVAAEPEVVFRYPLGDPHPIAYLRVLFGVAMCRASYEVGPWDELAAAWQVAYPLSRAGAVEREVITGSLPLLPDLAAVCLMRPMRAFGSRPLVALVDPGRVSPQQLARLEKEAGPALFTSPHWLRTESLRLLALSGYHAATEPQRAAEISKEFEDWMVRLGGLGWVPTSIPAGGTRRTA